MANVDFWLDTEPMAQKVGEVTVGVGAVGAAVTAMQVAVVKTEKETADVICRNLDNGFYMMVRSNLSQKVSQFTSSMNSRIGSMLEISQALDHTRDQMDGDFHRIKARYTKLFNGLDKALESRVKALDARAMALAEARSSLLLSRQCKEAPAAICYGQEIQVAALKAANAHMKVHAQRSLGSLGAGAQHIVAYERSTSGALRQRASNQTAQVFLPAVYAQVESLATASAFVPAVKMSPEAPEQVQESARARIEPMVAGMAPASPAQMGQVRDAFVRRLGAQGVPPRQRELMLGLFDQSAAGMQGGQSAQAPGQGDAS